MDIKSIPDEELARILFSQPVAKPSVVGNVQNAIEQTPSNIVKTAQSAGQLAVNAGKDVVDIVKGTIPSTGQAVSAVGTKAFDTLTGRLPREIFERGYASSVGLSGNIKLPPSLTTKPTSDKMAQAIAESFNRPSIESQTQEQAISEAPNYTPKNIGRTIYEHPLNNLVTQSALMAAPHIIGGIKGITSRPASAVKPLPAEVAETTSGGKPPPPISKAKPPKDMIDLAEVLPVNLEKTNKIHIVDNPYVRDNIKPFVAEEAAEHASNAAEAIKQIKPAIKAAQSEFYKKLGIKDSDPIDVNFALAKMQYALSEAPKYLDESAVSKVQKIYDSLVRNSEKVTKEPIYEYRPTQFDAISEGSIPDSMQKIITGYKEVRTPKSPTFGQVKEAARILYDMAEENVTPMGRKTIAGKFYTEMGNALTEAKKNDPRIAKASDQYSDLMDAEYLINKIFRVGREQGEMRLENRILSSAKDKGNLQFKENLNKLHDILAKYDETKNLVDYGGFTDKVKLAQVANDIATKKAITPTGGGRTPILKHVWQFIKIGDPEFQARMLAGASRKGWAKRSAIRSQVTNYPGILGIGGKTATRAASVYKLLKGGY